MSAQANYWTYDGRIGATAWLCIDTPTDPWERAIIASGIATVDPGGMSFVRILSPSFRYHDGRDYAAIGRGAHVIE